MGTCTSSPSSLRRVAALQSRNGSDLRGQPTRYGCLDGSGGRLSLPVGEDVLRAEMIVIDDELVPRILPFVFCFHIGQFGVWFVRRSVLGQDIRFRRPGGVSWGRCARSAPKSANTTIRAKSSLRMGEGTSWFDQNGLEPKANSNTKRGGVFSAWAGVERARGPVRWSSQCG